MIHFISEESQEAYRRFCKNRTLWFDYESAGPEVFEQMTRENTRAIWECAKTCWEGVHAETKAQNSFSVEVITVDGADPDQYIYYIHGGGFVHGEAAWGHFCAVNIAKESRKNIVAVNYRLAPKHRFPAAVDDCVAAYAWMLERGIRADHIVFLGESSGGNLVLASALGCKQRGLPMPKGIAAISPVVNLKFDFPSYRERAERECILPYNQDRFAQYCYMKDKDLENPLASPYFGDCSGFPPVFLGVSTEEVLFDDSVRMHEKLLREGVDSRLIVWEGMWHTFYMMDFPESWTVFRQVSEFFAETDGK